MKNLKLVKLLAIIAIVASFSNYVSAHTALVESIPKDEAMVMNAPEDLQLKFTESVRLLKIVVSIGEKELDIGFLPIAKPAEQFSVALPGLENGSYSVNWTAMGTDGHSVQGNISFMVGMMGEHHVQHEDSGHEVHEQHADHENSAQTSHNH